MRTYLALLMLVLLSACVNNEIAVGNESEKIVNEGVANNTSKLLKDIAVNDTGLLEWQKNRVGATMLVWDFEKAARMYLHEGQTAQLRTDPPVNVTLVSVDDGKVMITVNGKEAILGSQQDKSFEKERIVVLVDNIFS